MDKYIGYDLHVRVTFPADDVDIVSFLDEINATGIGVVRDVTILANENEEQKFLRLINDKEPS